MKKVSRVKKIISLFIIILAFSTAPLPAWSAPEILAVCGPCSRAFLPVAEETIRELGLAEKVTVQLTTCLGECGASPVIEFRGNIYGFMTKDKLKNLLNDTFPHLDENHKKEEFI